MGKISPVASKYIVQAKIDIDGAVDRPDVIGAIFGQTEGLLGADLELRELQRSGRIGRIEVTLETRSGKSSGTILIPSSLDKSETAIVGAALEIIQRIGPCNAKVHVDNIEDVRVSKRTFVVDRAKELLRALMDNSMPDSQELADEVAYSVRVMEIKEFGNDRLPAGPAIEDSEEIVIVEGRADVLNLLKHGFKNAIAMNGTNLPKTLVELSKKKSVTLFVDGDRGGNLIIKEVTGIADIDFVTKAPDGKEVEEITKKEIHKALRSRISAEQAKLEFGKDIEKSEVNVRRQINTQMRAPQRAPPRTASPRRDVPPRPVFVKKSFMSPDEKKVFKEMLENVVGTRGAHILDPKLKVMGKVPISELPATITSLGSGVHAVVFDGTIEPELVKVAETSHLKYLVGMDSKVRNQDAKVEIITVKQL